jgi:hypothetical protein
MTDREKILIELKLEIDKCKDDPVYFYNKYVKKEGDKDITEEEYDMWVDMVERQRHCPLKFRGNHLRQYPSLKKDCYER